MKKTLASIALIGTALGLAGCYSDDADKSKDNDKQIEVNEGLVKSKIEKAETTEEKKQILMDELSKLVKKGDVLTEGNYDLSEEKQLLGKELVIFSKNKELESIVDWALVVEEEKEEVKKVERFNDGLRYLNLKNVTSGTISLQGVYLMDTSVLKGLGFDNGVDLYSILAGVEGFGGESIYRVGTDVAEGKYQLQDLSEEKIKQLFKDEDEYNDKTGIFAKVYKNTEINKLNQAQYLDTKSVEKKIEITLNKGEYLWIKDLKILEKIQEETTEDKAGDESSKGGEEDTIKNEDGVTEATEDSKESTKEDDENTGKDDKETT